MKRTALFLLAAAALFGQNAPTVASIYDGPISNIEHEIVPLVEAMPADKFGFAPKQGAFEKVRTFAEQARHTATVIYMVSAGVLKEKPPVETGEHENGPASIKSKEQIVKYLKDAFAYAHKAEQSVTAANQLEMLPSPFGSGQMARGGMIQVAAWHSFDHYGQMVVYARMNGVVPPASQPAPPPPSAKKK
jgi:uncharacterized damage-inducible protein DinB